MRIKADFSPQEANAEKSIFRFDVRLFSGPVTESFVARHPEPPSRIIDIRGSQSLDVLHQAIFKAFDRFDQHMYEFQIGGKKPMDRKARRYGVILPDDDGFDAGEDAAVTAIASLPVQIGKVFFYWFDFGDDWWHEIRLLAINPPPKDRSRYPRIVEKKGESPPQYMDWDAEDDEPEDDAMFSGSGAENTRARENAPTEQQKQRLATIAALVREFCETRLTKSYAEVCDRLLTAIRGAWLPIERGKAEGWAAGLVHTAGMINFLHDPTSEPYMKLSDIAPHFGVSAATMSAKSHEIQDAVNAFPLDPRFCLPERMANNLLLWLREVNGIIVDFRTQPREIQEAALKAGLIPFIPEPPIAPPASKRKRIPLKRNAQKKLTSMICSNNIYSGLGLQPDYEKAHNYLK